MQGGFFKARFAAVPHAAAKTHSVGNNHLVQVAGLVEQGDGASAAGIKIILPQETPRLPMHFLRQVDCRFAARMVDHVTRVHAAVAAV